MTENADTCICLVDSFFSETERTALPEVYITKLRKDSEQLQRFYTQFLAAGEDEKAKGRNHLNSIAWKIVENLMFLRMLLSDGPNKTVSSSMSVEEKLFVSFGFLSEDLCGAEADEISRLLDNYEPGHAPSTCFFHEHLDIIESAILFPLDIEALKQGIAEKEEELKKKNEIVATITMEHRSLLTTLNESSKLLDLQGRLDEILPALSSVTAMNNLTPEMNRSKQKLTSGWNRLIHCLENIIATYIERKNVKDNLNRLLYSTVTARKVEHEISNIKQRMASLSTSANNLSEDELFVKVRQHFSMFYSHLRRANKINSKTPLHFALENKPTYYPGKILELFRHILATDARLEHNWMVHKWAKPTIVLVPSTGSAFYEKSSNRIFVPVSTKDSFNCTLVRELGVYRFLQDLQGHSSFGRLDTFQDLGSQQKVVETFGREYETYLMRESKGFRKLSAPVRRWFETNLSKSP